VRAASGSHGRAPRVFPVWAEGPVPFPHHRRVPQPHNRNAGRTRGNVIVHQGGFRMPFQDKTLTCVDCGCLRLHGWSRIYARRDSRTLQRCKARAHRHEGLAQAGRGGNRKCSKRCSSCARRRSCSHRRSPRVLPDRFQSRRRPGFARSHPPRHISKSTGQRAPGLGDPPGLICFPHRVIAPREGERR
jgi:hypothetical protein